MTRKLIRILGVALMFLAALMVSQPAALADQVTMTLTQPPGGNVDYGVYLSPYTALVTPQGSSTGTSTTVICIDFNDETYLGQTWQADTSAAPDNQDYDAIAYLALQLPGANLTQQAALSFAIWDILNNTSPSVENYLIGQGAGAFYTNDVLTVEDAALAAAQTSVADNDWSQLTVYTPLGCTGIGKCVSPQIFISVTPEGSTIATLLVDFLGLAGALFFLRRRLSNRLSN